MPGPPAAAISSPTSDPYQGDVEGTPSTSPGAACASQRALSSSATGLAPPVPVAQNIAPAWQIATRDGVRK